jgi:Meiotically up-regulated gene 113
MYVYFIKAGGPRVMLKIGKANDPKARMAELQTGCPDKLKLLAAVPCRSPKHAEYLEKQAHRCFQKYRARGEWFHYAPEIRKLIAKVTEVSHVAAAE